MKALTWGGMGTTINSYPHYESSQENPFLQYCVQLNNSLLRENLWTEATWLWQDVPALHVHAPLRAPDPHSVRPSPTVCTHPSVCTRVPYSVLVLVCATVCTVCSRRPHCVLACAPLCSHAPLCVHTSNCVWSRWETWRTSSCTTVIKPGTNLNFYQN